VDVIVGTGPHVLQPVEWLERPDGAKTLVWYSIGNLLSSQLQSNQLTGGVALFKATKKDTGVVISDVQFKPTFMSYQWSAADKAAQRLLARHDLKLQPLAQAEAETHLFGTTVAEQTARVQEWLGPGVEVTN
jgi:poly-gamma-glutamate synthesis protein (capsule biosynthesis protein)